MNYKTVGSIVEGNESKDVPVYIEFNEDLSDIMISTSEENQDIFVVINRLELMRIINDAVIAKTTGRVDSE